MHTSTHAPMHTCTCTLSLHSLNTPMHAHINTSTHLIIPPLSTHQSKTFYQHIPSTHLIITPYQHIISTHPINTHPINRNFHLTLSPPHVQVARSCSNTTSSTSTIGDRSLAQGYPPHLGGFARCKRPLNTLTPPALTLSMSSWGS